MLLLDYLFQLDIMGIGVELWRALVGLFNGGRGGRSSSLASNCREDVVPEKESVTNHSRNHSSSIRLGLTLMLILVFVSLLLLLAGDVELNPGPGLGNVFPDVMYFTIYKYL